MNKILKIIQIIIIMLIFFISTLNFNYAYATDKIASGNCGNSITWSLDSNGTLTITGSGSMSGSSCAWADYKDKVKNVEFSGNITSISECAFENNKNIETITLPNTVTSIQTRAFAECTNLKTVIFPKSIVRIGTSAFYKCTSLQSIDLSENLMYINKYAFAECTSLKSATIRAMYTSIGDDENTISSTAQIYGYKYSNIFYYARFYGRTFTDLNENKTTQKTITNETYLEALPKSGLKALGITSHNLRSFIGNVFEGYNALCCNEKDTTNATYQSIKATVDELTANCETEKEKARAIFQWAFRNIEYVSAYGATANINRIYSIFNEKRGSCEAYTMMTNYMLYLCGIPTASATNVTHEWSVAFVDGEWIYIDSTQGYFGVIPPNKVNQISFAYDGLIYVIDDLLEGGKDTGIAKNESEIEKLTSFKIPTNSYMKDIYSTSFDKDIELIADIGTVGEQFIRKNRRYCYTQNNQVIGTNTEKYLLGDVNGDGKVSTLDYGLILSHVKRTQPLVGDMLVRADVNKDQKVSTLDYDLVLSHVMRTALLF